MHSICRAFIASVAFALAGCAGHAASAVLPAGTLPASLMPSTLRVAGTYGGSIKEVEKGQTHTGTLTITIKQSGTKISGSFDIAFEQGSIDLTLSGSINKETKTEAKLAFTLYDASGNEYGKAKSTVSSTKLKGKAIVPPQGSHSEIKATFKAKRKTV